ncbi:MAG: FAD-binding oxidoreductase [Rubripirellula sp.]
MNSSRFTKLLVSINAIIPLLILGWDAWNQQLGANAVNTAIHITGIVSIVMLLLSLLITPLIRFTKQTQWFALRKTFGLFGFLYAVVHLAIYFFLDREGNIASTINEVTSRRFLQIGTLAILLLIPLALTSTQGMRKRLGIQRWNRLHKLAYLIAALVVLHYYLQVKSDTRSPIAFAIILIALLASRVPFWSKLKEEKSKALQAPRGKNHSWRGDLKLIGIRSESDTVKSFRFGTLDGSKIPFEFKAGQFLTIDLTIESKRVRRSYTISSSPLENDWIEITVKKEAQGLASSYLHNQTKLGDTFPFRGPFGKFTLDTHQTDQVILIAGGVGITPLISILRFLRDSHWEGDIQMLLSAKQESDLLFREELRESQKTLQALKIQKAITQQCPESWTGLRGRIQQDTIDQMTSRSPDAHVFICGPDAMADDLCEMIKRTNIPDEHIFRESFGGKKTSAPNAAVESGEFEIEFSRSKIKIKETTNDTVLDLAESADVSIESDCRSGICGQCKVKLIRGEVTMDCEDALSNSDKAAGLILACQANAKSNLIVDA